MILRTWRNISFKVAAVLTLLLCLFTILLTTPWGSKLTITLLNNIDGITLDYKAGALIRDVELNTFQLKLDTLELTMTDLVSEIDFSCAWRKKLCIESIKAENFSLVYAEANDKSPSKASSDNVFFVMPFAIEAKIVTLAKSQLKINQTVIDISQFSTQLAINASQFSLADPAINQLKITLEGIETSSQTKSTQKVAESLHTLFNTLPEVRLPIALNIQRLTLAELLILDKIAADLSQQTSNQPSNKTSNDEAWRFLQNKLSGTWSKSDVKITNLQTYTSDYSINQLEGKVQLIPPYKINTKLITQLNELAFWPEIAYSTLNLSINGALDNLALNVSSQGSLVLNTQSKIDLMHPEFPFSLNLLADKLPLPLSIAHYGKTSSLSLGLTGDITQQTINLNSQLNSYGYTDAQLAILGKHQQGVVTLDKLTFTDKSTNSQASLHGNIDMQPTATSWKLSGNTTGFTLPQINLKQWFLTNKPQESTELPAYVETIAPEVIDGRISGKITSTGHWSDSNWSFSVNDTNIVGALNKSALVIKGDIALNQDGYLSSGNLKQSEFIVALDKNKLNVQTYNEENWHVNGQLSIAEMSQWYKEASGAIAADFSIKGHKKDPIISLNTTVSDFTWQKLNSSRLGVTLSYQPYSHHKTQLNINNDHLTIADENKITVLQDLKLKLSGDIYQQSLQLDWQGDITGKLALTGQWHESINHWQSTIEQAALTYQQMAWRNNHTFSLDFDLNKNKLLMNKHCWLSKGVELCLPFDTSIGESGDVTLALNVDLSDIDELILPKKVQVTGNISGDIRTQWSPTKPILSTANFAVSSGSIEVNDEYSEQQISHWQQGQISFTVNENTLTSEFHLQDLQEKPLIDINANIKLIDDLPIDANIALNQFNLQPFQSIISNIVNLQGAVSAAIDLNGTIKSPLVNGNLTLNNAELLLSQNPNKFENINVELQISNNQAQVIGGFSLKEHEATLNGKLGWQDDLTMELDLNAVKLPLLFPPQLIMSISPALHFSLKERILSIDGTLTVLDGSYNIEKLPEGSITLSDDVIIVDQQGREVFKESSGLGIKTNVRVNIDNSFEILGQGLKSNLFGQLQISQQVRQPLQLFGSIQSDNGVYQAYGQKLKIEKGEVTFNGPINNPYLNLRASRYIKAEDVNVGLQITGLANSLNMQLYSTPAMDSPEMLSYLVRGRGLDSNSGDSSIATSMLLSLGVTGSGALLNKLEEIPLISDIEVDTEGDGDATQATISGYIANRVYLKYGIGVYQPINELTVRMFILNRLWLEIVSGIEQSSDIYYSFDIE